MASDVKVSGTGRSAADPLQPLITASRMLAVLVLGLLLLGTAAAVFGTGSVFTIGDDEICTSVSAGSEVPMTTTEVSPEDPIWGLAPGVSPVQERFQLCQDRPSATVQVLSVLSQAPPVVFLLGFLACVLLLVRRARRCGLFSRPVARTVHRIGWYVLAGALVAATGQALAGSALVHQMVPRHAITDLSLHWTVSIPTLLAGAGILTIARVLRLGVEMQDDLDATI
jgi:hypothetical protein